MSLYSNIRQEHHSGEEFLKDVPLFSGLDQDQLADVANRFSFRIFAPGVTIFHQDMPGTMLYLIDNGNVRVFSIGKTGQELTISIIGPGEIFGELALLDRKPHSASVVTLTETSVWMLQARDFDDLLEKYPSLMREINLMLVSRIRNTTHLVEAMTFEDILGRLAFQLLRLMEKYGQPQDEGVFITIPLTQAELATLVGATREHVNKCIAIMRTQNLITTEEARITLINPAGLKRIIYERGR
jgi:CRP/FNR family transcriptional regulator, cyclic AMP receptor protein